MTRVWWLTGWLVLAIASQAGAQALSQRGFVDGAVTWFPADAPQDTVNTVGDALAREEVFARLAEWLQLSAGIDLRANSHEQVEHSWHVDFSDRGTLRPAISVRRLGATLTRGPLTIDVGKQFIRWGKADIVTPTDRFAPRDYLNVIDNEFIAVLGVRGVIQAGTNTFDAVWLPRFTPSRVPLLTQRWTALPPEAVGINFVEVPPHFPTRDQFGGRWSHTGGGYELSVSAFDGFNHQPTIATLPTASPGTFLLAREYPRLRAVGGDAAVPTRWFTVKGEAEFFGSPDERSDEFVLYALQVERQTGEWLLLGGYIGEVVTEQRAAESFAPDRGLARSIVGRASYTIDGNRSVSVEAAVRQNGRGFYARGEYSQARGSHWRMTLSGVAIAGEDDDFLGQYHHNSHVMASLRYSF